MINMIYLLIVFHYSRITEKDTYVIKEHHSLIFLIEIY